MHHQAEMNLQYNSDATGGNKSRDWNLQAIMAIEASQMISSFHFELFALAYNVGAIYDQAGRLYKSDALFWKNKKTQNLFQVFQHTLCFPVHHLPMHEVLSS